MGCGDSVPEVSQAGAPYFRIPHSAYMEVAKKETMFSHRDSGFNRIPFFYVLEIFVLYDIYLNWRVRWDVWVIPMRADMVMPYLPSVDRPALPVPRLLRPDMPMGQNGTIWESRRLSAIA